MSTHKRPLHLTSDTGMTYHGNHGRKGLLTSVIGYNHWHTGSALCKWLVRGFYCI